MKRQLTYGSLFSGIGGFDLGFDRAGMRCLWQCEVDPYAIRVLEKHWPKVKRYGDITKVNWEKVERPDVLCGGDPCQANSAAGKSSKPSLGSEFIRAVDGLRPRVVVRENPSHVRQDAPWPWWRFRRALRELGYAVLPFRLRACCFGAGHRRDRLFVLGCLPDSDRVGLERGPRHSRKISPIQFTRLVEKKDWFALYADCIFRSRAGLPGYVDQVRCLGNAIVPQVAEWIGMRIVEHFGRVKGTT